MYDVLPVSWGRTEPQCEAARIERGAGAKMYDLLPVSWAQIGSQCYDAQFVAGVFGFQGLHSAIIYGLLSWSRSEVSAKMYELWPVSWALSRAPVLR